MTHTESDLFASALNGRTALITGGGSGIGFGIGDAFAKAGARVVIASRNQERIEAAVAHIRNACGQAMGQVVDVRDGDAVQAAVDASVADYGDLDIFVANAAGNFIVPFEEMLFNAWRTVVDIDLHGTSHCAKAAQPPLHTRLLAGGSSRSQPCARSKVGPVARMQRRQKRA
jgi:NAD(P)-dependent dehydrogenase (short-subunit alcohol dehydrogenase family)